MHKKDYMRPSMMVVKIQAHPSLNVSDEVGLHNEKSDNASYARRGSSWSDEDDDRSDEDDEYLWGLER